MVRSIPFVLVALLILSCAGNRQEEEIQELLANSAAHYSEKGAAALDAGEPKSAINYFRLAAKTLPNNPQLADNLGIAFFKAGELDSAIFAFQKAILLQSTYTKAYVDMGYAYHEKNDLQAAQKAAIARDALSKAGLYGVRVAVYEGAPEQVPYGTYLFNLLVSEQMLLTGEPPCPAAEVSRLLRPYGGVAFLGQTREGGAVTPEVLRQW
ncbi:MAG: hypothetical protein EHM72_05010, partial [Calditrichaeota bacterium]